MRKMILLSLTGLLIGFLFQAFTSNAYSSEYWAKTFGGNDMDIAESIQQTSDGGYVVAGYTESFGEGGADYWVLKIDSNGNIGDSCDMIASTNVTPADTYISATNTSVTPVDTSVSDVTSSLTESDSSLLAGTQCLAETSAFSYDIARFTQVGGVSGSATFIDEFDDGEEPPSGPSGPSTYGALSTFSTDAESGGLLNLNDIDTSPGDEPVIGGSLADSTYFFNSGSGGRLEGKFRFINGFETNTGFIITIHDTPLSGLESSSLWIEKETSGRIVAYFDFWIPDVGTIISQIDVTDLLGTSTDITLRLDINTANVVTASLDIGSDGSFDVVMPGSYALTFPEGTKHTGAFMGFRDLDPTPDIKANGYRIIELVQQRPFFY